MKSATSLTPQSTGLNGIKFLNTQCFEALIPNNQENITWLRNLRIFLEIEKT
jgi:hypothetical protein